MKVGDRVRLSAKGRKAYSRTKPKRLGTVTVVFPKNLMVLWDGRLSAEEYDPAFIEPAGPDFSVLCNRVHARFADLL